MARSWKKTRKSEWSGPLTWLKIHADEGFVVCSTDVLGKAEFSGSLFRETLKKLPTEVPRDAGDEECKGADGMLEIRVDRNREILQLIIDAMRGYPIEQKPIDEFKRIMILADCDFYKLPSISARFKPGPIPNWDLDRIKYETHTVVESERILKRTAASEFLCNGLNVFAKCGEQKWVEFDIKKTANNILMFGVVEVDDFATDGCFGFPLKGVGYYARDGEFYSPDATEEFAESSGAGDKIRIEVWMESKSKGAEFKVFKNGNKIGSKELSDFLSLDSRLMFAVVTFDAGDEVQILDTSN